MQRNMDLIRAILLAVESNEHGFSPDRITVEGFSEEQVAYHVWLLGDAGLMNTIEVTHHGSGSPEAMPRSLTSAGHDFLDAARNDTTWRKAVDKAKTVGGSLSLGVFKQLLESLLKGQLGL